MKGSGGLLVEDFEPGAGAAQDDDYMAGVRHRVGACVADAGNAFQSCARWLSRVCTCGAVAEPRDDRALARSRGIAVHPSPWASKID
jgi:hypothetical protein